MVDMVSLQPNGMTRRGLLAAGGAACLVGMAGTAVAVEHPERAFRVYRKGSDIGRHVVQFRPEGSNLHVTNIVDIKIKVAFVTAFAFHQRAEDLWQDGVLTRSHVETDDDGDKSAIDLAIAEDGEIVVHGPSGLMELPVGIMTDLCFWNSQVMDEQRLLDTGSGKVDSIQTSYVGDERVLVRGTDTASRRYHAVAGNGRQGDIWYDLDGHWVKASFVTRGERLDYELI